MTPGGLHHFALVVADLDRSLAWHADHLGFEVETRWDVPDAGLRFAHALSGGVRFEFMEREGAAPGPDEGTDVFGALATRGPKHVGLLCDDVAAAGDRLALAGVEVIFGPNEVPQARVRNLFLRDPDGHQVELVEVVA